MNIRRVGFCDRARWWALSGLLLASVVAKFVATGDTLYAMVQGSTFTAGGRAPRVPVRGAFQVAPQVSPMDREFFRLDAVRLETGVDDGSGQIWRGTGRYSFGGRGLLTQQLVLYLTDGTTSMRFDSGSVPVDGRWPELDLMLTGESPLGPTIHLMAVPELSRQHFRTVLEAAFLDDCALCDRLSVFVPMHGSFDLVRTGGNPLFDRYHLFDVRFTDWATPAGIELTGEGTLEVGGEVAIQQRWSLQLRVRTPADTRWVTFQNGDARPGRLWPMLKTELVEAGGTMLSRFYLTIASAPFREIWFTTASGMTSELPFPLATHIGNADILSDTGRLVVPAAALLKDPGLPEGTGVDAFDVVSGGGGLIAFSTDQDVTRPIVGRVSEGDVLGSDGVVWRRNQDLLGPFLFMPPTPDLGLDAVSQWAPGEIGFSIRRSSFSERLGVSVGRGDLLSSRGRVVRSNSSLLSRFQPPLPNHDYGLEGFHVWSSGEIWFSVEEGFQDKALGYISDGDLLSDQGYVVIRNLDLVRRFQPLEDLANFGLRGLYVISDEDPVVDAAAVTLGTKLPTGQVLNWKGPGRVFQVEATDRIDDPFQAVSPLIPATQWVVPTDVPGAGQQFFRIRSW